VQDERRPRAELIEAVVDGDTVPSVTLANYTTPPSDPDNPRMSAERLEEARAKAEAHRTPGFHTTQPIQLSRYHHPPTPVLVAVVIAAVVIIAAGGVWLFAGGEEANVPASGETGTPANAMRPLPDHAGTDADESEASALIEGFLAAPAWDAASLDDFTRDWLTLPADQRELALDGTAGRRLREMLHERLLQERALEGLDREGNDAALAGQRKIVEFARAIGIEDRRFRVAEGQ